MPDHVAYESLEISLRADLTEAQKQPVALLPGVTEKIAHEMCREYNKCDYSPNEIGRAYNTVLARHFREVAEARVKPTIDVEAVEREAREHYLNSFDNIYESVVKVLRRHLTDAPAQPLQNTQQLDDETLAAAVKRVERETRRKCIDRVRQWSVTGDRMMSTLQSLLNELERAE